MTTVRTPITLMGMSSMETAGDEEGREVVGTRWY